MYNPAKFKKTRRGKGAPGESLNFARERSASSSEFVVGIDFPNL